MLKVEKTFFLFFLVLFVLSFSRPGFAKDSTADLQVKTFQKNLNGILSHSCLKKNNYGIKIYSLDKGETLFQVRNDKLFIPASNLKLLTTALALKHLGPNHRFITRLYALGSVSDGILKGDLFIKGFGDPKLVTEQMW
ncbi:MAG: D-alanyl-D-alanine carboxypeptidase, partial [Nitrospinales bacterium]